MSRSTSAPSSAPNATMKQRKQQQQQLFNSFPEMLSAFQDIEASLFDDDDSYSNGEYCNGRADDDDLFQSIIKANRETIRTTNRSADRRVRSSPDNSAITSGVSGDSSASGNNGCGNGNSASRGIIIGKDISQGIGKNNQVGSSTKTVGTSFNNNNSNTNTPSSSRLSLFSSANSFAAASTTNSTATTTATATATSSASSVHSTSSIYSTTSFASSATAAKNNKKREEMQSFMMQNYRSIITDLECEVDSLKTQLESVEKERDVCVENFSKLYDALTNSLLEVSSSIDSSITGGGDDGNAAVSSEGVVGNKGEGITSSSCASVKFCASCSAKQDYLTHQLAIKDERIACLEETLSNLSNVLIPLQEEIQSQFQLGVGKRRGASSSNTMTSTASYIAASTPHDSTTTWSSMILSTPKRASRHHRPNSGAISNPEDCASGRESDEPSPSSSSSFNRLEMLLKCLRSNQKVLPLEQKEANTVHSVSNSLKSQQQQQRRQRLLNINNNNDDSGEESVEKGTSTISTLSAAASPNINNTNSTVISTSTSGINRSNKPRRSSSSIFQDRTFQLDRCLQTDILSDISIFSGAGGKKSSAAGSSSTRTSANASMTFDGSRSIHGIGGSVVGGGTGSSSNGETSRSDNSSRRTSANSVISCLSLDQSIARLLHGGAVNTITGTAKGKKHKPTIPPSSENGSRSLGELDYSLLSKSLRLSWADSQAIADEWFDTDSDDCASRKDISGVETESDSEGEGCLDKVDAYALEYFDKHPISTRKTRKTKKNPPSLLYYGRSASSIPAGNTYSNTWKKKVDDRRKSLPSLHTDYLRDAIAKTTEEAKKRRTSERFMLSSTSSYSKSVGQFVHELISERKNAAKNSKNTKSVTKAKERASLNSGQDGLFHDETIVVKTNFGNSCKETLDSSHRSSGTDTTATMDESDLDHSLREEEEQGVASSCTELHNVQENKSISMAYRPVYQPQRRRRARQTRLEQGRQQGLSRSFSGILTEASKALRDEINANDASIKQASLSQSFSGSVVFPVSFEDVLVGSMSGLDFKCNK